MSYAVIYKVKIRENILRQIIFTDLNIAIGIIALITALVWYFGGNLDFGIKVLVSAFAAGLILIGLTAKIDRQPAHVILIRAFKFFLRSKKHRT